MVAKQAAELDPNNPVVVQVLWHAKFVRRFHGRQGHRRAKEEGFVEALGEVDKAAIPLPATRTRWSSPTRRSGTS